MNWRRRAWVLFLALWPWVASAHVGSPDVFFDGPVGPYPARITIRMPMVVPGRAEISVRAQTGEPVEVSFRPLYSQSAVTNAPPGDVGKLIPGETNLYGGELWLMAFGGYSIEVKIHGAKGEGSVQIPVNSVAIRQLPLPPYLAKALLALAALLVFGGLVIVIGAVRDSGLDIGEVPSARDRRKGWVAGGVTVAAFAFALIGGNNWWKVEETEFRRHLRAGAWPDLAATVRVEGSQRILDLTLGPKAFANENSVALLPDHGKLLHFFLIREGTEDAFAHLHPVRKGGKGFEVAVPPLPEGRYKIMCDLTFEDSGMSFTATNSVTLPPIPAGDVNAISLEPDADDSWAVYSDANVPGTGSTDVIYQLPGGGHVVWKAHGPLRVRQDARLNFEVSDAAGKPVALEAYMGMISHAAVMRKDAAVFAHLHPSGNYSMAAQGFFQAKLNQDSGASNAAGGETMAGMDHSKTDHSMMGHMMPPAPSGAASVISLPYEFPTAGDYRIWVQFKTNGQVTTAVFDATVAGL